MLWSQVLMLILTIENLLVLNVRNDSYAPQHSVEYTKGLIKRKYLDQNA